MADVTEALIDLIDWFQLTGTPEPEEVDVARKALLDSAARVRQRLLRAPPDPELIIAAALALQEDRVRQGAEVVTIAGQINDRTLALESRVASVERMGGMLAKVGVSLRAFLDAMPKCTYVTGSAYDHSTGQERRVVCTDIATKAYARGGPRYCDRHAPIDCPDYPRAAPYRQLENLLREMVLSNDAPPPA